MFQVPDTIQIILKWQYSWMNKYNTSVPVGGFVKTALYVDNAQAMEK